MSQNRSSSKGGLEIVRLIILMELPKSYTTRLFKTSRFLALKHEGVGIRDSNFVKSYYGRDGFAKFAENNVRADNFLYFNKEKATTL